MKNQISFSPLIVGAMRLGDWGAKMKTKALERFIDQCLELGLKDFDHADIYGHYTSEGQFGEVLKRRPDLKKRVQITTKCGIKMVCDNRPQHKIKSYDTSKQHILTSTENSLKELGMECIDLLLIHRPDYLMNPYEIAEAIELLKKQGKVKYFGVSNFTTSQFEMLNAFTPLSTNQIEVSVLHRNAFDDGTLDQCLKLGIIPTAWSPFGGGAVFARTNDAHIERIRDVGYALADKHSCSIDQILLAWLLKHPSGIIPVLGTSKINRVETALGALKVNLSREEWYELWEAADGKEVP